MLAAVLIAAAAAAAEPSQVPPVGECRLVRHHKPAKRSLRPPQPAASPSVPAPPHRVKKRSRVLPDDTEVICDPLLPPPPVSLIPAPDLPEEGEPFAPAPMVPLEPEPEPEPEPEDDEPVGGPVGVPQTAIVHVPLPPVPEPATWALIVVGVLALRLRMRR